MKPLKLVKSSILRDEKSDYLLKLALEKGILKSSGKYDEKYAKHTGIKKPTHVSYVSEKYPYTLYQGGLVFETKQKPKKSFPS